MQSVHWYAHLPNFSTQRSLVGDRNRYVGKLLAVHTRQKSVQHCFRTANGKARDEMDYLDHAETRLKIEKFALRPAQEVPVGNLVRNRDRIKGVLQGKYLITTKTLFDPSKKAVVHILTNSADGLVMVEVV